jgi:hypothetical protein
VWQADDYLSKVDGSETPINLTVLSKKWQMSGNEVS